MQQTTGKSLQGPRRFPESIRSGLEFGLVIAIAKRPIARFYVNSIAMVRSII